MGNHRIFDFTDGDEVFQQDIDRLLTLFKLGPSDLEKPAVKTKPRALFKQTARATSAGRKIFAAAAGVVWKFGFVYRPLVQDAWPRPAAARTGAARQMWFLVEALICALTFVAIESHFRLAGRREMRATKRIPSPSSFHEFSGRAAVWANQF